MTVLYIILGIIIGLPVYLLLNTFLALLARPFVAVFVCLWPWPKMVNSSFTNEIKSGNDSFADCFGRSAKVVGGFVFLVALMLFTVSLICRFLWLVYHFFRFWFKIIIIKICWNLGNKAKTKTETK